MEQTTTTLVPYDIYDGDILDIENVNNKLLCTFVPEEGIESFIQEITSQYTILYNKIFVLHVKAHNEFVCTYNVDQPNLANIPGNTILVHRKKESNTLYTINALNELIKSLNEGVVDTRFKIDWQHYKNTILLTQQGELKFLKTKIHKVFDL